MASQTWIGSALTFDLVLTFPLGINLSGSCESYKTRNSQHKSPLKQRVILLMLEISRNCAFLGP